MAIENTGLNAMINAIGQISTLYLQANDTANQLTYIGVVEYQGASNGSAPINEQVTIGPIPSGTTITTVQLRTADNQLASSLYASKTINTTFSTSGNLLINSYTLTVTSTD